MAARRLRILRCMNPRKSHFRIPLVGGARIASAIEAKERVMCDFPIAGIELDRADISRLFKRDWDYKISIHILAVARQRVRYRHSHDEVWFAELPAFLPFWHRWQISGIALGRAFRDPLLDHAELVGAQPSFTRKFDISF